ncbi:type II secretion system protein GspM [Marinovum sp.]|uniref:type II secretion system protein GspM n=1 Tax=Marinovum sp. TaxID=2024839 RepID=UPI003A8D47C8
MIPLTDSLAALSGRERRLVGLLVGLALPLAAVFLLILPLVEARQAAMQRLAEARDLHLWVATQARLYPPARGSETPASARPDASMAGLEQSLVAAGLREAVTALSNQGADRVALRFERVSFDGFMRWFAALEATAGYRPENFTIEDAGTPGHVAVALVLEPAQ